MIAIIGAGPVGCFAAYKLATKGYNVEVFEEHREIGKPVHCTGLLTSYVKKIIDIESVVVNTISKAKLYAPNGHFIDIELQKPNIVVDREKFDKHIAAMALNAGAKIRLRQKFVGVKNGKAIVGNKALQPEWLIGADGPMSNVAKSAGLFCNRKFVVGSQARVAINCNPDCMEVYFGVGSFAWLVPESDKIARIGVVASRDAYKQLKALLRMRARRCKVLDWQGGLIPLYEPKQILQKDNTLLIGDAATQVKAFSFGGIVPGLIAANEAGNCLETYEKNCRRRLHKELWLSLMMRKAMDKFSNEDYNNVVSMLSSGKAKSVIENYDRDFPSRFIFKLILRRPLLIRYALKAIL